VPGYDDGWSLVHFPTLTFGSHQDTPANPPENPRNRRWRRSRVLAVASVAVVLALVGGGTAVAKAHKTVTLDVDGELVTVSTFAGSVTGLLADRGVAVGPRDAVSPSGPLAEGSQVVVRHAHQITVSRDGEQEQVWTTALAADEALDALARRDGGPVALVASRSRGGGKSLPCQYKVIFDKDYLGQAFHWSPAGCADLLKTDAPGADAPVARAPQRFELSADALFAFGRSDLKDIQPRGREELAAIASQLKDSKAAIIQVIGHTDRIGSEAANQALSQRRAQTVREFLIQNGVAADGLSAHGVGESQPVKQCADSLPHDELVACLQPNRRVEVAVMGFQ